MAGDFLIMVDSKGKLMYYTVEDQAQLIEYTTDNPIVQVFPNAIGTRCVIIDNTGNGTLYNPIDNTSIMIPNFQATTKQVLWD
jgi:WD repeat-containing protein 19